MNSSFGITARLSSLQNFVLAMQVSFLAFTSKTLYCVKNYSRRFPGRHWLSEFISKNQLFLETLVVIKSNFLEG